MSPVLPKRPRLLDQSPSIDWFDLPLEMREMVIDKMDAKTRCKFAQCSKLCEYEAKKSKNYLYEIGVGKIYEKIHLLVSHTKNYHCDYILEFVDAEKNQTIVSYQSFTDLRRVEKWTKMESGQSEDVRWKYFNNYMEKCNNSIRKFFLGHRATSVTQFNVKKLRNLEKLEIAVFSSKNVRKDGLNFVDCGFIEMKQLIGLKALVAPDSKLSFDQVVDLKAKKVCIRLEGFNEENIKNYLKMLKKGEIHENAKSIYIGFSERNVIENIQNVINGLNVFNFNEIERQSRILYTFDFLSDVKKNEMYRCCLSPEFIRLGWIEKSQSV